MISFDTNLLLYSLNRDCPEHTAARAFFDSLPVAGQVAICGLVLIELYVLLGNPAVLRQPLDGANAGLAPIWLSRAQLRMRFPVVLLSKRLSASAKCVLCPHASHDHSIATKGDEAAAGGRSAAAEGHAVKG
jgi:predicted nucleic acid-binding protein